MEILLSTRREREREREKKGQTTGREQKVASYLLMAGWKRDLGSQGFGEMEIVSLSMSEMFIAISGMWKIK